MSTFRPFGMWLARHCGGTLGLLLVMPLAPAVGQAPVDTRVDLRIDRSVQSGRMLDANPQLGAGGYNYTRPMSPLSAGNLTASGVAGGALSLRSFSPIGDPTAFGAPLGSAALYAFRRDSVSVASTPLGSGYLGRPYYDPSTTVPTAGFLQGVSGSNTGPLGSLDLRLTSRLTVQDSLKAQIVGLAAPAVPPGPQPPASPLTTTSSIFGVHSAPPRLILPTETELPWRRMQAVDTEERERAPGVADPLGGSADRRMPGSEPLAAPLGGVLRNELYPRAGQTIAPEPEFAEAARLGLIVPPRVAASPVEASAPTITDPSVLPGYDVFTDAQLAVALLSDPNPTWFQEMRQALREHPELAKPADQQAAEDTAQFLDQMLHAPLRSLTGLGPSALNDQMLKAESLMQIGHYSEAVDRYEAARMTEIANPLPLIGKGHALLAQGNYHSAALALLQGVELADRYAGLAPILLKRLDLTALMGGGEIVDIRRSDLLRRLEGRENPELRFLLGYLEYHSGDRVHGLENLKQAAENSRAGPVIGRYPTLLADEAPRPAPVEPSPPAPPPPKFQPAERSENAGEPNRELVVPPRTE